MNIVLLVVMALIFSANSIIVGINYHRTQKINPFGQKPIMILSACGALSSIAFIIRNGLDYENLVIYNDYTYSVSGVGSGNLIMYALPVATIALIIFALYIYLSAVPALIIKVFQSDSLGLKIFVIFMAVLIIVGIILLTHVSEIVALLGKYI